MHSLLAALVKRPSDPQSQPKLPGIGTNLPSPLEPAGPGALVNDLYARYARALLGYLYHRLPSLTDAEDVLAEVFLAALRAATRGEMPGPGWLMTVARRQVAGFYRERHHEPFTEEQLQVEETLQDPEWVALRAEERAQLVALVAELSGEQRDVLMLRFAGGLRSAEIAQLLGKTDEATRAMLSRTIRHLRKEWRG
jgi:RNA polymerase sigma-70 factor (ECF subfamily)